MKKQILVDGIGWGSLLWFVGYVFGIVLFMLVPMELIGWIISPIGIGLTLWVLVTKIKSQELRYYLWLALLWTVIAIVFDYFFLVKIFKPENGYYKLDVYVYYLCTFILPIIIGWKKSYELKN